MKIQRLLRGTYLLEFSLVTLGIAAFSVAALDLLTLYRTRSALQAAVDTGLRCLYPLDAECRRSGVLRETGARGLFDVYHSINLNQPLPPHYSPVEQWQAAVSAEWYQLPAREVTLESVSYIEPRRSVPALAEYTTFPVISQKVVLETVAGLPRVSGTAFNERFVRAVDVGGVGQGSVGSVGGGTDRTCGSDYDPACLMAAPTIRSVQAILNPEELRGYRGELPCPGQVDSRGECRIPAYILVRGRSSGVAEAQGKLTLEIEYNEREKRPLGGRLFASANSAHLVPRGISLDDVESDTFEPYTDELTKHVNVTVPLYGEFRLRFFLQSLSGHRVEWNSTEIMIFTPVYRVQKSTVECGYRAASNHQIDLTKPCPDGSAHRMIDPERAHRDSVSLGCVENTDSDLQAAERAGLRLVPGMSVIRQSAAEGCSEIIRTTVPCPDSAISTELACGTVGHLEGAEICPVPPEALVPEWTARTQNLITESGAVCHQRAEGFTCGDRVFESAAACPLAALRKYRTPTAPFLLRTCGDEEGLESRLRDEAAKIVPKDVPVVFEMQRTGTLMCDTRVDSEACRCFKRSEAAGITRTLCAAGIRRGSVAAAACCGTGIGECEFVPTRLPSYESKKEISKESLERARVVAEEAAGAILGGFTRCKDEGNQDRSEQCARIDFDQDAVTATGRGQAEVPLRLLRLTPGEGTVSIAYTASRPLEAARLGGR
jgi:hypothetical protein